MYQPTLDRRGACASVSAAGLHSAARSSSLWAGQLKVGMAYEKTVHVLKFANNAEMVDWKKCLILWKDYSLEHGQAYYKAQREGGAGSSATAYPATSPKDKMLTGPSGHSSPGGMDSMDVSLEGLEAGLDDIPLSPSTGLGEEKPPVRMGYVEMNTSNSMASFGKKDWKRRYMKIDTRTGELCIYNSQEDDMCIHIIKCMNIQSVETYNKRGGDRKRFNVSTISDETFKFQCASAAEGDGWVNSLNDWKDYALMNMSF